MAVPDRPRTVVCVKHAAILGDEIEFADDGLALADDVLEWSLNEWDAFAVEEALRIRERRGGEVVAVTVGDEDGEPALRRALAMGADRAIRVAAPGLDAGDALAVARALAAGLAGESPDLILCGVQSADAGQGATGPALAELLDLPSAAVVTKLEPTDGGLRAERELEGGTIALTELPLPALVTVQSGINAPRYATLRQIKQAEQREIELREVASPPSAARLVALALPERGDGAQMLAGAPVSVAQELLRIVRERVA